MLVSSELQLLVGCIFIRGRYFSYMLSDSINCHVFSFLFDLESVFLIVLSAPFFFTRARQRGKCNFVYLCARCYESLSLR